MNIQDLRASFIEIKTETDRLIELLTKDWFNEENFIKAFSEVKPVHLSNDILMGVILDGLQLIDNEKFYKHYSLEDIDFIYSKLIEYDNRVSLDLLLDYSHFLYSIADQNQKAELLSEEGIRRAKTYERDFKKLVEEINVERKLDDIQ